jgi:protein-tyrosine phosphatase
MINLFAKSKSQSAMAEFKGLRADVHSHLIPGIDDGSPNLEMSLRLIKGMADLGFSKLITTPHIMGDIYKNDRQTILEQMELLRQAVNQAKIDIELVAAAEYFLDDHVATLIRNNEPLLTISGNMILVEFSMANPSLSLKDILFEMQMQGYQPVIAHPERYIYLENAKDFYTELKDIGCYFQLNLLSLINYYGKSVQDLAHFLIKKEYYDLVGSDLHNLRHLEALQNPSLALQLHKLLDSGKIKNSQL